MTEVTPLALFEVVEMRAPCVSDARGFFSECWNESSAQAAGIRVRFVQDNHVYTRCRGTVRGLHYQLPPFAQAKLVRVTAGAVFAVAVDIRRRSPAFGRWASLELSRQAWNQMFVPAGFAFGYMTLEDECEVLYKVTAHYSPAHERSISWNDPAISIAWPGPAVMLSDRDRAAPPLAAAEVFP